MNIEYQYGNDKVIVDVQRLIEGCDEDQCGFLIAEIALKLKDSSLLDATKLKLTEIALSVAETIGENNG